MLADLVFGEGSLPRSDIIIFLHPYVAEGMEESSRASFLKALNAIHEGSYLHDLINCQSPPLLIQSYWELEFQHVKLWGTKEFSLWHLASGLIVGF